MSLLWRNTHCRERREIEEYSSLEVTDSDNNFIKESIEFSEPSFRTNLVSESELLLDFGIRVKSIQNSSYKRREREMCSVAVFLK